MFPSPQSSKELPRLSRGISLLVFLAFITPALGQSETKTVDCPPLQRAIGQRVLLVSAVPQELTVVEAACKAHNFGLDTVGSFDSQRDDYRRYFLIVAGSNAMDYWGDPAQKAPAAFQRLEQFVRRGGHLMVFNTFNGRHMDQLARFGIKTHFYHTAKYEPVKGVADVVFAGSESLIPPGDYLAQSGNFAVSTPHTVVLRRGEGSDPGAPALATLPFEKGRVTYSSVEPMYGDPPGYWLMQVLVNWAARGAPTTAADAESARPVVVPLADEPFRQSRPIPDEAALQAAEALIGKVFGAEPSDDPLSKESRDLAQRYWDTAATERDSAVRYLLLLHAVKRFAAAGDVARTIGALRDFSKDYGDPDHDFVVTVFRSLQKSIRPSVYATQDLLGEILELANRDCNRRRFDAAMELVNVARELAEASHSRRLMADVEEEGVYIESVRTEWSRLAPFLSLLEQDPADPAARTELGLFLCCLLGRWSDGFAVLVECNDPKLQDAALRELGKTDSASDMTALGDLWNKIAAANERHTSALKRRAAYWYWQAAAKAQGLEQASIRKKLDELSSPRHTLRIKAPQFTGSARLQLSSRELKFEPEGKAVVPTTIQLGSVTWKLLEFPTLPNRGVTRVTPRDAFLFTATAQPITGRGTATITSVSADEIVIELKSPESTSTPTEFILRFGE